MLRKPRSRAFTASDLIPTLAVIAVTVWAVLTHRPLISWPGTVLAAVMILVTVHPRHTLRGLTRRGPR